MLVFILTKISKLIVTVPYVVISQSLGTYVVFYFSAHNISFNALIHLYKAAELKLLGGI